MQTADVDPIYLRATPTIEADHPLIVAFAQKHAAGTTDPVERSVRLYYAVRDGIRYDPYQVDLSPHGYKATTTLASGRAWCVPKAILLAACCRALQIPARLGFADVRNHLSTERMRREMKTDVFLWHGYTSIWLNGSWMKATPAFNVELCQKFRLQPLEFDGLHDSIYHPFDLDGNRHMEYLQFRGEMEDVPIEEIGQTFLEMYTPLLAATQGVDFDKDVEREIRLNYPSG